MIKERTLAFITGDALVTASFITCGDVGKTIILGTIGGLISMFSKDIYLFIKGKIKTGIVPRVRVISSNVFQNYLLNQKVLKSMITK